MLAIYKLRYSFDPGKKNGSTIDKWVCRWYGCLRCGSCINAVEGFFGRKGIFNNGVE